MRFLLLTAARGAPTRTIACRLGERNPASLESIGDEPPATSAWFTVRVTPALLQRLSGDGLAIPDLRSAVDVAILERAATLFPPLGSRDGWNARFGRELNATDDREHFGPPGRGLPVVEGKQIEPFRADLQAVRFSLAPDTARRLLEPARYGHRRLAYRDVASATNRLTLIAALLPAGCVSTHTVFCLRTPLSRAGAGVPVRPLQQLRPELLRAPARHHARDDGRRRAPAGADPRHYRPRALREIAALARVLGRRHDERAFARLQALVASLYQLSVVGVRARARHVSARSRGTTSGALAPWPRRRTRSTPNPLAERVVGAGRLRVPPRDEPVGGLLEIPVLQRVAERLAERRHQPA